MRFKISLLFFAIGFFTPFNTFAWQETEYTLVSQSTFYGYQELRDWTPRYYGGLYYSSTTDFAISSIETDLCELGSGTYDIYANIINFDTGVVLATSTDYINIASLTPCNTFTSIELNFSPLTLEAGVNYVIGFGGDTTWNSNNYYKIKYGGGGSHDGIVLSNVFSSSTSFIGGFYGTVKGYLPDEETPVETPSISTSTIEWIISSTTEAIHTVGYSVNLYIGIIIFLIFVYFGYSFIRFFL